MIRTLTIFALLLLIMESCEKNLPTEREDKKIFALAVHGGAGNIKKLNLTETEEEQFKTVIDSALQAGYVILEKGGSAKDAVVAAITILEDSPLFNAGRGAVFNHDGINELDASIMEGKNLEAGAVASLRHIKNPIQLALVVLNDSKYIFLSSDGAEKYAQSKGIELIDPKYFFTDHRWNQLQEARKNNEMKLDHSEPSNSSSLLNKLSGEDKFGTVGCVALDQDGNVVAGTSTGGLTNKDFGRIGDSPIIGAGTYANNKTCAVSCTGRGEDFIRLSVAHEISAQMMHGKKNLKSAVEDVIQNQLKSIDGRGGCIAIDKSGNIIMSFTTTGMYRGWMRSNGSKEISIY